MEIGIEKLATRIEVIDVTSVDGAIVLVVLKASGSPMDHSLLGS